MADATVSRLGAINAGSDKQELFLKVFSGEVMSVFDETNLMKPLHMTRTITSGKSAQFPKIGTSSAAYHAPGDEIVGTSINHAEVNVAIDGLLISHAFIASIDDAVNHYDVRSEYSHQLGQALANKYDKQCLIQLLNGAAASATLTGGKAGGAVTLSADTDDLVGDTIAGHILSIAKLMDQNDIPENDRYIILDPVQYYAIVSGTKAINRDWGGSGSFADGEVLRIAGINVLKSNHLPQMASAVTSDDANMINTDNNYQYDARKCLALAFHRSALATVQLLGLKVESEWDIRRQGTLLLAKFALGTKFIRPESCFQIKYSANQSSRA